MHFLVLHYGVRYKSGGPVFKSDFRFFGPVLNYKKHPFDISNCLMLRKYSGNTEICDGILYAGHFCTQKNR